MENFRCHRNKEIEINKEETTLIMGKSGAGKTTIFEAIIYVLYNNVNKPATFGSKKCKVTMTDGEITIMRQKDPNLLQVKAQGKIYENDVAQSIINKIYGDKEVFMTACYIKQMEKNVLFYGTNQEKIQLIREITLEDTNPEEYRIKTQEENP